MIMTQNSQISRLQQPLSFYPSRLRQGQGDAVFINIQLSQTCYFGWDSVEKYGEFLYSYNANNAVSSITHSNVTGSQIVKHSYTYDETNNIVEYLNSIDGQTSYDYDFLGQLIGADYANGSISDENYTYDENGNRITANGSNYTTGDNNELTSDGDYTYTYDAEGNRSSKSNSTDRELYEWDYRNRLTQVIQQTFKAESQTWETVQIVEYAYDYNNIWIRKTLDFNGDGTADSKTIFIPESYQTTVQLDDADLSDATGPTSTHHYLWTPNAQDKLLADTTSTGISWALADHLGTIRDIIGSEAAHLIYDAFGNLTSGTNPLLFGFTGKPFDIDTHLQNNINRWYDADVGRWLSNDPIGFDGNDTNLYRYIQNHPSIFCDPSGLELQQAGCCNSQRIETILDITNQILLAPKCQKWFRNHGFNGPIGTSPNWTVNCHSNWKVMCLLGFPAWTMPGLGIGLCESQLDSYGDIAWASLLIHELAHHFCTSFAGREACAISAQNDCDGT
ncbi:MAG: hypothetical protein IJQ31_04555 [Thermoguttaceae bacterium]|nr:hypothetical protein [Thermoguttaceae bacterium]